LVQSERHEKRAQILDAALEVFSRKGVYATRIADIASEAGIAYGLVYHYFKNKEEVLNTIFEERWARVTELLEEADNEGTDSADRLRRAASVFLSAYQRRPQVVELLLLEFTRMSKFLEPTQIDRISKAFGVVTRIIERGQAAGELRGDIAPGLLTLTFLGGLQLIMQTQVLGSFHAPESFEAKGPELVVDAFLNGVLAQ
jgi:AcrR family transcriptional regulator